MISFAIIHQSVVFSCTRVSCKIRKVQISRIREHESHFKLIFMFFFQTLKPSNHATIQSLVHAIGIPANVPAPCCVPDTLSSVTLLFFDENRNVVLKNYPAMSVQSCACRWSFLPGVVAVRNFNGESRVFQKTKHTHKRKLFITQ